jgi:hypothetical protein
MFSKREWLDDYKKLNTTLKIDERNLIQSHLREDYHANKIFNSLLTEVDQEKKFVDDSLQKIKLSVDDVYSYLKGFQKASNLEIRQKIIKIEELLNRNRLEFKNKFENLLLKEEELENDLDEFQNNLDFEKGINNPEENENEKDNNNKENKENNNINKYKTNPEKLNIDNYIEYILSTVFDNAVFEEYTENKVEKMVKKINDLIYIKDKTYLIEIFIDKNLNGFNLGWQPRDHQDFLRLVYSHNGKINTYEFINELENILPFLPKSELKKHIKEYKKFLKINELKKLLIIRYKEIKLEQVEKDKQRKLEILSAEKNKKNKKSLKNLMTESQIEKNEAEKNDELNIENEKKMKLEEWKMQKEIKKRELEDLRFKENEEKKLKEKILYEEKKKNLKPAVEEYKKWKEQIKYEKEFIKQCEEMENKIDINPIDIQRIQDKNKNLLEKKTKIIRSKSANKFIAAEKYMKFKAKKVIELEKVESKLNEHTEGYVQKQRKKHDYKNNKIADTMGGNVLGRMARAIPAWRKGIN